MNPLLTLEIFYRVATTTKIENKNEDTLPSMNTKYSESRDVYAADVLFDPLLHTDYYGSASYNLRLKA